MSNQILEKPTSVIVIGWIAIILAATMVLSSFFRFYVHERVMQKVDSGFYGAIDKENRSNIKSTLQETFTMTNVISIVQIVAGATLLFSAIFFLRLKQWSRFILEAFGWIFLVIMPLVSALSIYMWLSVFASDTAVNQNSVLTFLKWFGSIVTVLVCGLLMAILTKGVRALRSNEVRNSMLPS